MSPEQGQKRGYSFAETNTRVEGMIFNTTLMREGVIVDDRTLVRYVGSRNEGETRFLRLEFHDLIDGKPANKRLEEARIFRRYKYEDAARGQSFLVRAFVRRMSSGRRLDFQFSLPGKRVRPARELGIKIEDL